MFLLRETFGTDTVIKGPHGKSFSFLSAIVNRNKQVTKGR